MYEPRLEHQRRRKMRREAGEDHRSASKSTQEELRIFAHLMVENLQRPFRMLATQVIVQLLAIFTGLLYGIIFLFLFIYPRLWRDVYGQSVGISSLNYISFSLGLIAGTVGSGALNDRVYVLLRARNGGVGRPEFRVPTMLVGVVLLPVGLLWWGWSGEAALHWIMPNIGAFFVAAGMYNCVSCVASYTIDTYTRYAASAISTNILLRSLTAAFFPLFAPYMFDSLGFGWSATVLAGSFAVVGGSVVAALWFFGEKIRAKSPYCAATGDEDD
jgi:MFS family permease